MAFLEVGSKRSFSWPIVVAVGLLGWLIFRTVYNLFFHPLAKYPGPFWAKISCWPSFYHTIYGDRNVWLWQCFQIYADNWKGKKIRIDPDTIVFNYPKAYRDIYNTKANVKRSTTYDMWRRKHEYVNTFTTSDVAVHARKRQILNTVFTDKSISSASDFIIKHVDRWNDLSVQGDDWSEPLNAAKWVDSLIFDILGDLCFGKSFETKEPGENPFKPIPEAVMLYMKFTNPVTRSPFVDFILWLKPRGFDRLVEMLTPADVKHYYEFLESTVTKRSKLEDELTKSGRENERRRDMFHYLYHAKDIQTGQPAFSHRELMEEAQLLIIAGSDTTSTILGALFFYLTHYPRIYKKLADCIRSTFETVEEIQNGPKLASCHYLRACIDEAMRIAPPVPGDLLRTVLPGGLVVDGAHFPEGVNVGTASWTSGHNDESYIDSSVYRPERWLVDEKEGNTAEDVAQLRSGFYPFSNGPGNCVGQNLARLEMMLVVARTLFRLDFRLLEGSTLGEGDPELGWGRRLKNVYQLGDAFVAVRDGPMVQFRKRRIDASK